METSWIVIFVIGILLMSYVEHKRKKKKKHSSQSSWETESNDWGDSSSDD